MWEVIAGANRRNRFERECGHCSCTDDGFQLIAEVHSLSPTNNYSTILLADCIWASEAHDALLKSCQSLLSQERHSYIHLVSGFHSGRAGVRAFLRKAAEAGFEMPQDEKWEEFGHGGNRRPWDWDLVDGQEPEVEAEKEAERNRWCVVGKLRRKRD